ncbi:hypothetical protein C5B42_01425 [Candidatus Cerribacteria bacterium 'Amazon FNV 2010 28 9']|uniref:Uncharacterized protein n=1 Tax=Candidatus Cerribacteria bacterium 'Amazon FNV 2010 28 9' TaxID=2081795 RepID=A0A317JPY3_9BACT|nr:MAG: hypothetical protein C5B42_01425 [Candidatus Cerribacteria bacterium 'Amazon FNV 2010 28 9']
MNIIEKIRKSLLGKEDPDWSIQDVHTTPSEQTVHIPLSEQQLGSLQEYANTQYTDVMDILLTFVSAAICRAEGKNIVLCIKHEDGSFTELDFPKGTKPRS